MKIVVTGAAGNVGREALQAFDGHDVTAVTHRDHEAIDSRVVDVEDRQAVRDVVAGHDVVVHLAANPDPGAEWDDIVGPNIEGTYNVYAAAAASSVDRVVFASTNHVHQSHVLDGESLPDRPRAISVDDPFRPDSYYGVSKVTGEALGSFHADRDGLEVVNLRIGWLLTREQLREREAASENGARFARAIWLSPRDCRQGLRKAVTEPLAENPLSVNLVSANSEGYFSLVEARCGLRYRPEDDASEVLPTDSM
ncbi:NAD-dependent epimerase/dehydratase family protein [Halosimplex sp. TS25]|uniref:NAD-dependent epimerase/dehydratase family protein n=1 Tax=Halosimplex rarum TaxID=3396619 RepID=UPI0039ED767F